MAGKSGGAWKVAYADFVTAMMAFFMVMWLISQDEQVKEAVAEHFRDPHHSRSELLPPIFDLYPKNGLSRKPDRHARHRGGGPAKPTPSPAFGTDRGDRTRMGTVILFDEGSADLTDDGRQRLDELVPLLAGKPQKIEIRGHATPRPLPPNSPFHDAWQLSYARCLGAMQHLQQRGIPLERIRLSQAGPFEPFTIGADPERMRHNSCVEVFLLAEMTNSLLGTPAEREERFVEEDHTSPPSPAH